MLAKSISHKKKSKSKVSSEDEMGRTPLHNAVKENNYSKVKALLKKGANIMDIDHKGWNALHTAAEAANYKMVLLFLSRKGTNVHCLTNDQESVFSFLARHEEFETQPLLQCLRTLLSMNADPSIADSVQYTPLHYACDTGTTETVEFLLKEAKLNPNTPNCVGNTPLHLAVQKARADVVSLLLEYGDYASIRNHRGLYPSDVAIQLNYDSIAQKLQEHVKKFKASMGWSECSTQPTLPNRFLHSTTLFQSKLFIIGGCNHREYSKATEFYNSVIIVHLKTGTWEEKQENQLALAGHSASLVGSMIYISGGFKGTSRNDLSDDLYSLDINTLECKKLCELTDTPHHFHQSVCISRLNVLFFACKGNSDEESTKYFNMIHLYDIKNNAFLKLPTMSTTGSFPPYRESYSAVKVGDKVFLFAGEYNSVVYDDLWLYDAKANSWTTVFPGGYRPTPRSLHGAAVLQKELLIFGGRDKDQQMLSDYYGLDTKEMRWVFYNFHELIPPAREGSYCLFSDETTNNIYVYGACESNAVMIQLSDSFFQGNIKNDEDTSESPSESPVLIVPSSTPPPKTPPKLLRKKRRSFIGSDSSNPMSTLRKIAVSNITRDLDESQNTDDSNLSQELSIRPTPPPRRKKKISLAEMLEIAAELEDYSSTLCDDVLHLVSTIDSIVTKESSEEKSKQLKELLGMCQDLSQFIEEQKPTVPFDCSTNSNPSSKLKIKASGTGGSHKSTLLQSAKKYCIHHYESLSLPPVREDETRPEEFTSLSKTLQTRFHIINEILSTETDYVRDLGVLIGIFMNPLRHELKDIVNQYDFNSLFKNLESLFTFNSELLNLLVDECKKPPKEQDIGGIFLRTMESFRKYLVYCANQTAAGETLLRLEKENIEFREFVDLCFTLPQTKAQGLDSYIIKPFQRICRYPLLLKELRKNSPNDWPYFGNLSAAITEINVIVQAANDSKKHTDSLVEIMEIQNQFVLGPGDTDLMQMHKWTFVKEGSLRIMEKKKITSKQLHFVLFQEVLVIAQPKGKKLHRLYSFPTENILIFDPEVSNEKKLKGFPFSVVNITNNAKVDVACMSMDEKNLWISSINQCGSVE